MKELNIMEATVLTSPNPLTLICSKRRMVLRTWLPFALCLTSPSIRLWWASPLANSPTPASVCVRPAKSSSLFPASLAGAVMACGASTGAETDKAAANNIEMMAVEGSDIQIPADTRLAMVATLQQSVEVGDHILHICQVDKFLGDEDKKGLYAWNGFGKVAPAAEG